MMENREEMICRNIGLVHTCARRFSGRGIEYDDLFQTGCVGLIKAVDGFETERGLKFSTYAVPVILGEIKRLFRDTGPIKLSRSLKETGMKLNREREYIIKTEGREPSISELSSCLGIEPEQAALALNASLPPLSLTRTENTGEEGEEWELPVVSPDEKITERLALQQLLGQLSAEDRTLIILRYLKSNTQVNVANRLGISQVQVSRRERVILEQLRKKMTR